MMVLNKTFKYISLLVCIAFTFVEAKAQSYSFLFIQADKDINFEVKMNNKIVPQYGKSYIIIPQLSAGTQKVYILFPKGESPAQRYLIEVPDKGSRSFLLTHYQDAISLYDLQNLSYLSGEALTEKQMAAENPDNKKITEAPPVPVYIEVPATIDSIHIDTEIKDSALTYFKPVINEKRQNLKAEQGNSDTVRLHQYGKGESYYTSSYTATRKKVTTFTRVVKSPTPAAESKKAAVAVKGCGMPIGEKAYDDIYIKSLQKTEKERLKFLVGSLKNCFSSNQIRVLVLTLSTDPERYAFLKQAYVHVSDKANFGALEGTLTKREWKDYFESIIQ